eukprot:TRINITY_DN373_c0_g2_i1.p1 TRINITY_DN373_c0_g2~~TRINITY_DN373_c0_g2_i1.p1  ORF type:complete len:210 (-),score=35.24 TRINITY_DN373_c0_g2_i1:448-1077(-)
MESNKQLVQVINNKYYIVPYPVTSAEELKRLDMEGKLMKLEPEMSILDDHLKTFNDGSNIIELVDENKKNLIPETQATVTFKDKKWLFTYKGYRRTDEGQVWNKLEIRCPNDGFKYTDRPTVEKIVKHHNRFNFSSLDLSSLITNNQIPFITKLSQNLQANTRFLYNLQDRRMDILFRVENRRILEISFEPGYPIDAEENAKKNRCKLW